MPASLDPLIALPVFIACYLIGSVSFTRLISRAMNPNVNLQAVEVAVPGATQNYKLTSMGASTAERVLGKKAGAMISVLDTLKIVVPALIVKALFPGQPYVLFASVAAIIGHDWPIYYKFHGGRGMAVTYGGLLVVDWLGTLVTFLSGMFLGIVVFRSLWVVFVGGLLLLIPWFWFTTHDPFFLAYAIAINVIFWLALLPEIRQTLHILRTAEGHISADIGAEFSSFGNLIAKLRRSPQDHREGEQDA